MTWTAEQTAALPTRSRHSSARLHLLLDDDSADNFYLIGEEPAVSKGEEHDGPRTKG